MMDEEKLNCLRQIVHLSEQMLEMLRGSINQTSSEPSSSTLQEPKENTRLSPSVDDRLRKVFDAWGDKDKAKDRKEIEVEDERENDVELSPKVMIHDKECESESESENSVDDDGENEKAKKIKKRTGKGRSSTKRYSKEVTEILSLAYEKKKHLSTKERSRLANTLGITSRKVTVWFQNRRSRDPDRPLHPKTMERRGQKVEDQESPSVKLEEDEVESTIDKNSNGSGSWQMISSPSIVESEKDGEFEWELEQSIQLQPYHDDLVQRMDKDIKELNAFSQVSNVAMDKSVATIAESSTTTTSGNEHIAYTDTSQSTEPSQSPHIDLSMINFPFDDFMNIDFDGILKQYTNSL